MRYPNHSYGPGDPPAGRPRTFGRGDHSAPGPTGRGDLPPADLTPGFGRGRVQFSANAAENWTRPDRLREPWERRERRDSREPWEPPAPLGPRDRTAGLVRDAADSEDLSIWAGRPAPRSRRRSRPGRLGARHARRRRGRTAVRGGPAVRGGLAVAAGLLVATGAVPLGVLAVRALAHHGTPLSSAPMSASRPATPAHPRPAAPARFSAVAGPGCPPAPGVTAYPYHALDGDGWHAGLAAGSGPCGRSYLYSDLAMVPGQPGQWHDHYAWIFRTAMTAPSCTLSFYIPASPQSNSVAYYWFSAGSPNAVDRIADFTIDQAAHQGEWVSHGPFTFPGGTVLAEVTDRGEAPLPATAVAGPARLSC